MRQGENLRCDEITFNENRKKKKKVSKLAGDETCILKFRKEKQSEFSWNSVYFSTFSRLKTDLAGLYWSFDIKAR